MAVTLPDFIVVGGGKVSGGGGQTAFVEIPNGPINGLNRIFTLRYSPTLVIALFLNGIGQNRYTGDYTLTGNTIVYTTAPQLLDDHWIVYFIGAAAQATGRARQFSAATDKIDWGNSSVYRIIGDVSFGCWVKLPSNANGLLVSQGDAFVIDVVYELAITGSSGAWSVAYLHGFGGSGSTENHVFPTAIPNDSWRYIGFSRDTTSKSVYLYVGDGATLSLAGVFNYTNNPTAGADARARLNVGNYNGGPGGLSWERNLVGTMEEHYIWSRAISQAEHAAAMAGNPSATNLILACGMGNSPEVDNSVTASSGVVTGTVSTTGHN